MKSQVSIVRCTTYQPGEVQAKVKEAIGLLGGVTAFIKPGSKVLVKPNLLMAKEPEYGIVTHPEVVRAIIKILKEISCNIIVGDGPSVWGREIENVDNVYLVSGIKRVCTEEDVELVKFDKRRWRGEFPLTTWLDECDYCVNVPKFKTHEFTLLTGAIKNLFGLVSGTYKTELHKKHFKPRDFSRMLVDILAQAKPALTVIDGISALEGDGPATSGKLRQLNLFLASSDCVALDSIMAVLMGIQPKDVLTTREAASRRLGNCDMGSISILGETLAKIKPEHFMLPTASLKRKLPAVVAAIAQLLIRYYPYCLHSNCTRCLACVGICPQKCIMMRNNRIVFDYRKCIACFCCQESCPAAAIKVKKSFLARAIGL